MANYSGRVRLSQEGGCVVTALVFSLDQDCVVAPRRRACLKALLLCGKKDECDSVVAVAQAGGCGAVVKAVALVSVALCAVVFGTREEQLEVAAGGDGPLNNIEKARPAGAALIFHCCGKERLAATGTGVNPLSLFESERIASGMLRPLLAQYSILLGG